MRISRQNYISITEQLLINPNQKKLMEDFVIAAIEGGLTIPSLDQALELAMGFQATKADDPFNCIQTSMFLDIGRVVSWLVQMAIVKERM